MREYYKWNLEKVLTLLRKQGKKEMVDNIFKGKYTLEEAILSEVYFLTPLDLWVLAEGYQLPIVLFHQKKLKHLIDSTNWVRLSECPPDKPQQYFFVRVPTEPDYPDNHLPQYSIIKPAVNANAPELIELFSRENMNLSDYFGNMAEPSK
jgi:hypothetical protein